MFNVHCQTTRAQNSTQWYTVQKVGPLQTQYTKRKKERKTGSAWKKQSNYSQIDKSSKERDIN